jgi:ATP-binding cassette, subfamily B, multidrug efflux pump
MKNMMKNRLTKSIKEIGNIRWIWRYYKAYQLKFYLLLGFSFAITFLLAMNPRLIGQFVEVVITSGDDEQALFYLGGILAITIVGTFGRYFYLLIFQSTAQDVLYHIRQELYNKIQNMDQETLKANRTGTLMSRMIGDTQMIGNFLSFSLQEIIGNVIMTVLVLFLMYTVNPLFFVSFLIPIPLLFYVGFKHSKEARPGFVQIREQYAKLNTVVQENVTGNRVVRAFMNKDYEYKKFNASNDGFRTANLESVKVWSRFVPVIDGTGMMMVGILLLSGGILYTLDAIRLSDIIQMSAYLALIDRPIRSFGWTINKIEQLMASTVKVREVMELEAKLQTSKDIYESDLSDSPIKGDILMKNVSFKFDDETVINDFNLHIPRGTTVAFVGATGSGKSTVIDLIGRFYEVNSGEIRIDNKPLADYDLKYLRSQISLSMQNVFLFSDTIENNIRYGFTGADDEEVYRVAGISGVHEFVEKMPEGYGTVIGENGVGLSGGQKQRIALARALLKNQPILILDDTTSSVDMETEYQIHQGLKKMKHKPTTIIVAHRISSIKHADEIVVMDKGSIIERGTHRQLLQQKGYYYQVFKNQMGDFDTDIHESPLHEGAKA